MKKYIAPQMNIVLLEVENIITTSDHEIPAGDLFGTIFD